MLGPVRGAFDGGFPANHPTTNHLNKADQLIVGSIRPEHKLAIININFATASFNRIEHGTGYPKYPTFSPDGKWVIFSSESNGKFSLYICSSNGNNTPRKLTDNDSFEGQSVISPDGYIYFTSSRDGKCDIFRAKFTPEQTIEMNSATNMTKGNGNNFSPSVSPDGRWLAFTSNRHSKEKYPGPVLTPNYKAGAVYVMPASHSDMAIKVTSGVDSQSKQPTWEGTPTWTRDGKSITFYSVRGEDSLLYNYEIETGEIKQVGPVGGKTLFPSYNPKTEELSYTHLNATTKKWEVCTEDSQGVTSQPVNFKMQHCWAVSFSPNGSLVASISLEKNGKYLVEKEEDPHAAKGNVNTYNSLFPVKEGNSVYAIEEMSRVTVQRGNGKPVVLADPVESGAFGIAKAPGKDWLLTTFGRPFKDAPAEPANIYRIPLDKSTPINLTEKLGGRNVFPTISEDGTRVIFVHQELDSLDKHLFLTDAAGKFFKQLTTEKGIHTMPSISSDGKKVVFSFSTDKISYKIRTLHLKDDGTPGLMEEVTKEGTADTHPVFSRTGDKIAFSSNRAGLNEEFPVSQMFFNPQPDGDVYVKAEGKKAQRVTNTPFEQATPSFTL